MTHEEAESIVAAEIAKAKKAHADNGGKPEHECAFVLGWLESAMARRLVEVANKPN
jgi:hypothetical protein